MMRDAARHYFTPEEYFTLEEISPIRHEYYEGEIYDMAGGSPDHGLIQGNLITILNGQLHASPCRVFSSDVRILVEQSGLYTYPDLSVVCGKLKTARTSKITLTNPVLLVEVLSESTRAYDRGEKLKFYKQIPSLKEIMLVDSERARVEVWRRGARNDWAPEAYERLGETAVLESIRCEVPLARAYEKVSWNE
jgi:Uma2 family endonuclease